MSWCDDAVIDSLYVAINDFRLMNSRAALARSVLGQKYADLRAVQFGQYFQTNSPQSPNFNPHQGFEATAAAIGYDIWSENLAYITQNAQYILSTWQDSLHLATLLARDATVYGVSCVFVGGTAYWAYGPGYSDRQGQIVPTTAAVPTTARTTLPPTTTPTTTTTAATAATTTTPQTTSTSTIVAGGSTVLASPTDSSAGECATCEATPAICVELPCDCSKCKVLWRFSVKFDATATQNDALLAMALQAFLPPDAFVHSTSRSSSVVFIGANVPVAIVTPAYVDHRRPEFAAALMRGGLTVVDDKQSATATTIASVDDTSVAHRAALAAAAAAVGACVALASHHA